MSKIADEIIDCLHMEVEHLCYLRDTYLVDTVGEHISSPDMISLFGTYLTDEDALMSHLIGLIRRVVSVSDGKAFSLTPKIEDILSRIESYLSGNTTSDLKQLGRLHFMQAKLMNLLSGGSETSSSDAKLRLRQALKCNPSLADAWCELAEAFWTEGNPEASLGPLRSALKCDPHHSGSLWRLSMLLRQFPDCPSEKLQETISAITLETGAGSKSSTQAKSAEVAPANQSLISESLRFAHSAVQFSPTNGRAWECLANALLTAFFSDVSANAACLSRSLAAFTQAAKDPQASMEPNFHYNRGVAWHYEDNFPSALESWFRASLLDPAWQVPRTSSNRLISSLLQISAEVEVYNCFLEPDAAASVGARKRRRFLGLIENLTPCITNGMTAGDSRIKNSPGQLSLKKLLGPYHSSHIAGDGQEQPSRVPKLRHCLFSDLQSGSNSGAVVVCRVVSNLPQDSDLALNQLVTDARGSLLILRIYQIAKGQGPCAKDAVAIPDPFIEECKVSRDLLLLVTSLDACIHAEGGSDTESNNAPTKNNTSGQDLSSKLAALWTRQRNDISFRIIRVPIPNVLVVNGRRIGASWTAPPVLKNVFFTNA